MNNNENPKKLAYKHRLILYKTFAYFLLIAGWAILTLLCVGVCSLVILCVTGIDMPERTDGYLQWIIGGGLSTLICLSFGLLRCLKPATFKRFGANMYSRLCKSFISSNNIFYRRVILFIINVFFGESLADDSVQNSFVTEIIEGLKSDVNPTFFIVCGPAHSGKTVLIYKVMRDLSTSKKHADVFLKYAHGVYYYDMTDDASYVEHICKNFDSNLYSNALLIIDNTHHLSRESLEKLTSALCGHPSAINKVIILTRDDTTFDLMLDGLKTYSNRSIIDMRFNNEWNGIAKPDAINNAKMLFNRSGEGDIINALNAVENGNIIVHIYRICDIGLTTYPKEAREILHLILKNDEQTPRLMESVLFVCCACAFTGQIKDKIFKKWCAANGIKNNQYRRIRNVMLKSGFLHYFANIFSDYLRIHEKVAQGYLLYFKEKNPAEVLDAVTRNFNYLSEIEQEPVVKWYYEHVSDASETHRYSEFCDKMKKYQFVSMLSNIEFLCKFFDEEEFYWKYLSVLNDRVGNYIKTYDYAKLYFDKTKDLDMLFPLLQGEHRLIYNEDYQKYFDEMRSSSDSFLKFAINYWDAHIKIHKGASSIAEFDELLAFCNSHLEDLLQNEYLGYHELRRCYFDYLRQFYIEGVHDIERIKALQSSKLNKLLNDKIPGEFNSYEKKFLYGHYAHYVGLVQLAIYRELDISMNNSNSPKDAKICADLKYLYDDRIEKSFVYNDIIKDVTVVALENYRLAGEIMKKRGDKTNIYVNLRVQELKGIDCKTQGEANAILEVFDSFIEDSIKNDVQEYIAYGHTYKLKLYLCILANSIIYQTGCDFAYSNETCVSLAKESLAKAREAHKLYHGDRENEYANVRLGLYEILIGIYESDIDACRQQLRELEMLSARYGTELGIIKRLVKIDDLSPEALYNIFKYYPIILQ